MLCGCAEIGKPNWGSAGADGCVVVVVALVVGCEGGGK